MPILYFDGNVSVNSFKGQAAAAGLDPKKLVFIFPGNSTHHAPSKTTLFSVKSGSGLAQAARQIGEAGFPTLSLPTTSMEQWSSNETQKAFVEGALADLYRALGAGYSLFLPVREHMNSQYFNQGLAFIDGAVEPNFWGGIQAQPNKKLAAYYIAELDRLHNFIDALEQKDTAHLQNNRFYAYFLEGQKLKSEDFKVSGKLTHKTPPAASENTPDLQPRATHPPAILNQSQSENRTHRQDTETNTKAPYEPYLKLWNTKSTPLLSARELLNDYTKGNSCVKRFFYGHWNRHHVAEIAKIVDQIDKGDIRSAADLMDALNAIVPGNPKGSFARRREFTEQRFIDCKVLPPTYKPLAERKMPAESPSIKI
ncbi:Uncharacterised protein (plasmid) [Legionella adelaidensis]|uniref:RavJ-like C-terminal domain-containing protein n=1 Tax=Legionella adelaidensis TaxID=45056 RepID=A0A0W0R1U1_9GAMM|nr:DUF5617 domain-containing protein [Legionella adelaidensis]KTC65059.1 hypothetical protein Lade_1582 [Legionella adelaidensis]VEH85421.1 Uncharacterised protein [Legionella adelaidensis]